MKQEGEVASVVRRLMTQIPFLLGTMYCDLIFFFSSRRRHTRSDRDWSSDVCSSDLAFREAKAAGVQHLIATHAADAAGKMTLDQMKEAARLGAWIEFDYRNTLEENRTDLIRGVGPENCFLSEFWTNNQLSKEYSGAAWIAEFAAAMKKQGNTDRDRYMIFKDDPTN